MIESVRTDGGAFNVREGNHSENLAATYGLRSQLEPSRCRRVLDFRSELSMTRAQSEMVTFELGAQHFGKSPDKLGPDELRRGRIAHFPPLIRNSLDNMRG